MKSLRGLGLAVPNCKLFQDKKKMLIEMAGVPVSELWHKEPQLACKTYGSALHNLLAVWQNSKETFKSTRTERDYTLGSIRALDRIRDIAEFSTEKKILINGVEYPSLQETITACHQGLTSKKDTIMVISHGDEYSSNIVAQTDKRGVCNKNGQHLFIDPRESGFYGLSAVLNIIWGQTLLHDFKFDSTLEEDRSSVRLSYTITPSQREVFAEFNSIVRSFLRRVVDQIGDPKLLKEYMFCNLARTLDNTMYDSRYVSKISPSKLAFFCIAMEIFHNTTDEYLESS